MVKVAFEDPGTAPELFKACFDKDCVVCGYHHLKDSVARAFIRHPIYPAHPIYPTQRQPVIPDIPESLRPKPTRKRTRKPTRKPTRKLHKRKFVFPDDSDSDDDEPLQKRHKVAERRPSNRHAPLESRQVFKSHYEPLSTHLARKALQALKSKTAPKRRKGSNPKRRIRQVMSTGGRPPLKLLAVKTRRPVDESDTDVEGRAGDARNDPINLASDTE